jgi:hypothetical protein
MRAFGRKEKNMFCSQCGAESQPAARFCHQCGVAISSAPAEGPESVLSKDADFAIWNPNAAANWSLIFTPAFGAYLQMLNWRTLGETKKSFSSENWFYASLVMLVIYVVMGSSMDDSKAASTAATWLGFLFLCIWYFASGRAQCRFVKEKFGKDYSKKPWGKPLLIAVAAVIGCFTVAVVYGFVLGVALET